MNNSNAMNVTIELVTPQQALQMLQHNDGNRPLRKRFVDQYVDDIIRGKWKLSHQGVAFSKDGRLLDGQHRLTAIVESGISVQMVIARNVDEASFLVMDRGKTRSLRDILDDEPKVLDACSFIARMHGLRSVEPHHVQDVVSVCGPFVHKLLDVVGGSKGGRTPAPIRAAAALRMMQGHEEYVSSQWKAFATLDFDSMSPSIKTFYRQIAESSHGGLRGYSQQWDRAMRAWVGFDPKRTDLIKITIRSSEIPMSEMRSVWKPSWSAFL